MSRKLLEQGNGLQTGDQPQQHHKFEGFFHDTSGDKFATSLLEIWIQVLKALTCLDHGVFLESQHLL